MQQAARITYQLVAPMEVTLGQAEIERRQKVLQEYAAPGVAVEVRSVARGTASIESAYEAALVSPYVIESLTDAVRGGSSAVIIGCFSDPALDGMREAVDVPVVGPGMAAMMLALQLGDRFSIIAPNEKGSGYATPYVRRLGVYDRYASIRGIGLSVVDLARDRDDALRRATAVCRTCIEEDGAEVLVLGCMSMAFLGVDADLQQRLGVPVVNPVLAALKTAEMMLAHRITHSRRSWSKLKLKPVLER